MGAVAATINPDDVPARVMSIKKLLGKMNDLPLDRDFNLDGMESLTARARRYFGKRKNRARIIEESGLETLTDVMGNWHKDEVVVRACITALSVLVIDAESVEHCVRLGAREMLEHALQEHKDDQSLVQEGNLLLFTLLGKGSEVAIKDIKVAVSALDYCESCRPLLCGQSKATATKFAHLHKNNDDSVGEISTIVRCMKKFQTKVNVQEEGCEALVAYSQRASHAPILRSGALDALMVAMNTYPDNVKIQWRCCVAMTNLAKTESLSSELGKKDAIRTLLRVFQKYELNDDDVCQWVIWTLSVLVTVGANRERMAREGVTLLLCELLYPKEAMQECPFNVPLRLRKAWTREELEAAREAEKEKKATPSKKKKDAGSVGRAKPKKGKYGRAGEGDDGGVSGLI